MRVGMLGSGVVGRTLAGKIGMLGHEVTIGTRDVEELRARSEPDQRTGQTFADWHAQNPDVKLASFGGAAEGADLLFNATNGSAAIAALTSAGADRLAGKIVVDISNPLDFSKGFPPSLLVVNTDSLGEQIQRAFPEARVVKTLNTVSAVVMVDPGSLAGGEHHLFVSGNDTEAKSEVTRILKEWFGWRHVLDLGDITTARGTEMYMALWIRTMGALGSYRFNVQVVT